MATSFDSKKSPKKNTSQTPKSVKKTSSLKKKSLPPSLSDHLEVPQAPQEPLLSPYSSLDTPELEDSPLHISNNFIQNISDSLRWGEIDRVKDLISTLHVADLADLIESLSASDRDELLDIIGPNLDPEVLSFLEESVREKVILKIGIETLSKALMELDSDDALSIIEALEPEQQQDILRSIPARERATLEQILTYPEESAARLMQQEIMVAPPFWTVEQTLRFIRTSKDLPDSFYDIFVVDPKYKLLGTVSLNKLMRANDADKLKTLLEEEIPPIPVTMDQKDVAFLFQHYNLVSAPVVNENNKLLGVITADDMIPIVEEETEKEVLKLAGVGETDFHTPLFESFYRRVGWLSVTLIDALLTTTVISQFTTSIERMIVLAVLMPIVAAMGGNAGMQAVTITVRALATYDLRGQNQSRAIFKELLIGALNGVFFALILVIVAVGYYNDPGLAGILAGALIFNMLWAALAGVFLPIAINRMGFDPAVASGPLLVTTTDIFGYAAFLGFATLFLL